MKEEMKVLINKLRSAKTVFLCAHKNPDGDALCSVLALARLIELNFKCSCVCAYDGNIPDCFDDVPNRLRMKYCGHIDAEEVFDVAIILDYGTKKNIGGTLPWIEKARYKIEIDHHINPSRVADLCLDDTGAAAVGEIIFRIMSDCDWGYDADVSNLLAISILTDTGFFKYVRHGKVLRIMAQLVDRGVDINNLADMLNNKPRKTILTESGAVAHAQFFLRNTVAIATITHKEYKNLDGRGELVLNLLGQIKGVNYVVLLKEQRENQIGVSLRSKDKSVEGIATQLGGGGHICAAGAVVHDTLQNVQDKVLQLIIKEAK